MGHETTYVVTRISTAPVAPFRVFFNAIGRSLEWNPADAAEQPGSPQEVPAAIAAVIQGDESLAPHFRVEPAAAPVLKEVERPVRRRSADTE